MLNVNIEELAIYMNPGDSTSLTDLTDLCAGFSKCLKCLSKDLGEAKAEFKVIDLTSGSVRFSIINATIAGAVVIQAATNAISAAQDGKRLDPRISNKTIDALAKIGTIAEKNRLKVGGIELTGSYRDTLEKLAEVSHIELGSVSGKLESVSVHKNNVFTIFPPSTGEKVVCNFENQQLDVVSSAIGKRVTVHGKMYFSSRKKWPVKADVKSIVVHRPDNELPRLSDIKTPLIPTLQNERTPFDDWGW